MSTTGKGVTRRALAASALLTAAASGQPPQAAPTEDPAELLRNAREQVRRNSEALAKYEVPVALEPAFQFKP